MKGRTEEEEHYRAYPLIGPEDPPPFRVVNPDGKAQVILVADHASHLVA